MYNITFEIGNKKITKTAHNKAEVIRLVYIYTLGSQEVKQKRIDEILEASKVNELNEFIKKQNKKEKNADL